MSGGETDIESRRWQIDDQKADYRNIRSILRKYFFGIASVALALLVAYVKVDDLFAKLPPYSLPQDSFFTQIGVIDPQVMSMFASIFSTYTGFFSALGVGIISLGLLYVFLVEASDQCLPAGDSARMFNNGEDQLREWVEHNDSIIEQAVDWKRRSFGLGIAGTSLIGLSYFSQIAGTTIIPLGVAFYGATFYVFWRTLHSDLLPSLRFNGKLFVCMVSIVFLTETLVQYQETFGYMPKIYSTLWFIVLCAPTLYYLRGDLEHVFEFLRTSVASHLS